MSHVDWQGKWDAAEGLMQKGLDIIRKTLGQTHPDACVVAYNLVGLLQQMGKLDEAKQLCESELAKCQAAFGDDHEDTINFIEQLDGLR